MGYWLVSRVRNADRRLALAWLTGILVIPIGCVYYLTLGAAAFAASWTRRAWIAWAILCVPMWLIYPLLVGDAVAVIGVYSAGVLVGWITWSLPQPADEQHHEDGDERHQQERLERGVAPPVVGHAE